MNASASRRVLVTGGSMGIGLAVAQRLADQGDRVIIAARGEEALAVALEHLTGVGHQSLPLDVADPAAWLAARSAIDSGGPLHGLVCCAGVLGPIGTLDDVSPEAFAATIAVNLDRHGAGSAPRPSPPAGERWPCGHPLRRGRNVAARPVRRLRGVEGRAWSG